ncbi:hypothetical protein CC86DRAFT_403806 [Ophiobolus disseminans]|uniref:FHA domain-containing protein n=1 Tax=Ophiobolus disseminans TaxID=1469910 RepID=A0A6A7A969_9PLEO|nr:hypothetical protein CC86DRAFT_403806 [Ophiobolus disseminans]
MDPVSIAAGCLGLVGVIGKVSSTVSVFVHEVREARSELDAVSRELMSLRTILEMLNKDVQGCSKEAFPISLGKTVSGIVINCTVVVEQIDHRLKGHLNQKRVSRVKWTVSGRDDVDKLRSSLESHKGALDLALNVLELSLIRDVKKDTSYIRADTGAIRADTAEIQETQAETLRKIAELMAQVKQNNAQLGALVRDGNSDLRAGIKEKNQGLEQALRQLSSLAESPCEEINKTDNYRKPTAEDEISETLARLHLRIQQLSSGVPATKEPIRASQRSPPPTPLTSDPPPAYEAVRLGRPPIQSSASAPTQAQGPSTAPYDLPPSMQSLMDLLTLSTTPGARPSLPQLHSDIFGLEDRSSALQGMALPRAQPSTYTTPASTIPQYGVPSFPSIHDEPPAHFYSQGPRYNPPVPSYTRPQLPSITLTEYMEPFGPTCPCCVNRIVPIRFAPIRRTLPHPSAVITLGREDIPTPFLPPDFISFDSPVVSRLHCKLFVADLQWYIQDLGSSNGTQLNETVYREPGFASSLLPLSTGDIIQLGTSSLPRKRPRILLLQT